MGMSCSIGTEKRWQAVQDRFHLTMHTDADEMCLPEQGEKSSSLGWSVTNRKTTHKKPTPSGTRHLKNDSCFLALSFPFLQGKVSWWKHSYPWIAKRKGAAKQQTTTVLVVRSEASILFVSLDICNHLLHLFSVSFLLLIKNNGPSIKLSCIVIKFSWCTVTNWCLCQSYSPYWIQSETPKKLLFD